MLASNRWSKTERRREDIEFTTVYLLGDGSFALAVDESIYDESVPVQFAFTDLGITSFEHPVTPAEVVGTLDFDDSRGVRLRSGVHAQGDGARDLLLALVPESERPRLRRMYPTLSSEEQRAPVHKGTLTRYFPAKSFGFIRSDQLGDVFLHANQIPEGQRHLLAPGALIGFDVKAGAKGPAAQNARVIG